MFSVYKTLYNPSNPKAEYQKQSGVWVKRLKGSKLEWNALDPDGTKVLDGVYKSKGSLFFYSDTLKYGSLALILGIGFYAYIKLGKKNGAIKK
jgi:hypothetical protein